VALQMDWRRGLKAGDKNVCAAVQSSGGLIERTEQYGPV
jgi:hypothetical protein